MTNHTAWRQPATAATVLLAVSALALGACTTSAPTSTSVSTSVQGEQQVAAQDGRQEAAGSDTIELVNAALDTPAVVGETPDGGDRPGLRARLLRALHATWVTDSKQGPVTHQAIRGDVTAVSATSITVTAKDGVSMTFTVGADTRVRARVAGTGRGVKGTDSTIGAVTIGSKALVTGVGTATPTARAVVHLTPASPKPSPTATS